MFTRLGNSLNKYALAILLTSIVFIVAAGSYGMSVFSRLDSGDLSDQTSESTQVIERVRKDFGDGVAQVVVLFESKDGLKVNDPAYKAEVERLLGDIDGDIKSASTYYSTGAKELVSNDNKSTYAALLLPGTDNEQADKVAHLREKLVSDKLHVSVGGQAAVNADVTHQINEDLATAETISFAVLAILLVLVFRSVIAALLPLLLGGFAIVGAFFVTRLLTEFVTISQYAINIITLLGLGLAIDYSLFIVSRFREELHSSRDVDAALKRTMETAGHTVFFSGLTVIASLLCLQVFPVDILRSMSWGGAAAVLVAMIGAMLVLPAILRLLGIRIDALSFGATKRNARAFKDGQTLEERETIWSRAGRFFMRFRWIAGVSTTVVLLAAGLPFLHAHFSTPDYRSVPEGAESRTVSEKLSSEFGDVAAPLRVIYTAPAEVTGSDEIAKLYDYVQSIRKLDQVSSTVSIVDLPGPNSAMQYQMLYAHETPEQVSKLLEQRVSGNTTLIDINYKGDLDSDATQKLVNQVRDLPRPDGITIQVGGGPAILHDLLATIGRYIPYGLVALAFTLFVLLFWLSRSVVIPLQAITLSTLSLGAAFGALVWVFQDGHWASLFNLTPTGSIDATMPVLIFAVAFGLSVDYSVFLYSRIREEYDRNGGDNSKAVILGLQKTGSIITSAAILLFIVVAAFAAGRIPLMQQVGVGLALTVLIDAFIIRMMVVPALMSLLGHANWWRPKFLVRRK